MQLPAIGIRGRLFLFGILPAMLILTAVLSINFTRMQSLLLASSETSLLERVKMIAADVNGSTLEAVTTAKVMALAARNGLFGKRSESLVFAQNVLENHPQFSGAYYGYEPNADGLDAEAKKNLDRVPAEALGNGGRFIPYYFRDRADATKISLTPLVLMEGLYYEGCKQRFLDPLQTHKAMVTEPYSYQGTLMVEQTYPIEINGVFVGVAGVDRSLDEMAIALRAMKELQLQAGWNLDIFIISRLGKVIASTVTSAELCAQDVRDTPYAKIFTDCCAASSSASLKQAIDPLSGQPCLYASAKVPTGSWTVVMQLPTSDIMRRVQRPLALSAALGVGGMLGVLGLIAGLINSLTGRIAQAVAASRRVAAGDLTGGIDTSGGDEAGQLLRDIGSMTTSLRSIVSQVKRSSVDLTATAKQLSTAGQQQESAIGSLGASTSEVAVASRQIAVTGKELLGTMNEVAELATETEQVADAGRENLASVGETMTQLEQSTANFSQRLALIRQRAEDINMVITTITKVADQTNLLSINAAIEAEKAGEYGQGFIVVAREIRRLANQTAVATLDIERLVEQMQQAVGAGVMEMDRFSAEVKTGVERVSGISSQFVEVIDKVHGLSNRFDHVNQGMESQAAGAQQITEALMTLTDSSRTAAESLQEFKIASQYMVSSIDSLTETVSRFRVDNTDDGGDLVRVE